MISSNKNASAASKDSGEITLDAILISYVSAPLGTSSSAAWTPQPPYTTTLALRSLANPDLSLRARISADEERINSRAVVAQIESEKIQDALTLFARPHENESYSVGTPPPGSPENTVFFGLYRPIIRVKGNGRKANFKFVDAEASFSFTAKDISNLLDEETASSILRQYVFDRASLVEPRFILAQKSDGGPLSIRQFAERGAPKDITSVTTARIIEQSGFRSDALKEAFAVDSPLEVTYYSAVETRGEILRFETNLERTTPGFNSIYWDRVFKTFVITDGR
ncbi:MAG TPA: hypothetical protein VNN73_07180 [Blastocatellia bacterium]|nr:hypothetical protein [Blastocatellia bacterium]